MLPLLPLILFSPMLLVAAYCDLKWMRIPNYISIIGLFVFVFTIPILDPFEAILRLSAATVVFVVGFILFAMGLFGGGDVKLLAALMLVVPTSSWGVMPMMFSGAMLAGMLAIGLWQRTPKLHGAGWVSATAHGRFPMGISITGTGLTCLIAAL